MSKTNKQLKPRRKRATSSKTKPESAQTPVSLGDAVAPVSAQDRLAAVGAYLQAAGAAHLPVPADFNPTQQLTEAGFQLTQWGDTVLATGGATGSATTLIYLPPDEVQAVNLAALLTALSAWQKAGGLPVGVKILLGPVDGDLLTAHRSELAAKAVIYILGEYAEHRPVLSLGVKGLLEMELSTQAAQQEIPSAYSEIMPTAAWPLIGALDALKDTQEIKIDGFLDDLIPLPLNESKLLIQSAGEHAGRLAQRREKYGFQTNVFDINDVQILQLEYRVPTVNVSAIECGNFGSGRLKLPSSARATVDCYLLPDQQPDRIFKIIQDYLLEKGFEDVQVRELPGAYRPSRTPLDDPFVAASLEAVQAEHILLAPISPFSGPLAMLKDSAGFDTPGLCVGLDTPTPNETDFITQARLLAHLLPIVGQFVPAPEVEELFTFELPPELTSSLPSALTDENYKA